MTNRPCGELTERLVGGGRPVMRDGGGGGVPRGRNGAPAAILRGSLKIFRFCMGLLFGFRHFFYEAPSRQRFRSKDPQAASG